MSGGEISCSDVKVTGFRRREDNAQRNDPPRRRQRGHIGVDVDIAVTIAGYTEPCLKKSAGQLAFKTRGPRNGPDSSTHPSHPYFERGPL